MTKTAADDWPRRVGILGVGLLGGSVAMSIRRQRPKTTFVGLCRNEQKRASLACSGIVQHATLSAAEAVEGCDVVVAAGPVDRIAPMVIQAASSCPPECLITDVGSTKGQIVQAVACDPVASRMFVAAHPIAGSEKSGAANASATLFDGKLIILTPGAETEANRLEIAERFWRLTGGRTLQMSPADHDTHLAAVSHVPHLVSALVALMADSQSRPLVGSGWEDITRVASGDPTLWTAICQQNRAAIRRELDRFGDRLNQLRQIIDGNDDQMLWSWLADAKRSKEQSD
jgi:prephenate dehydrogenase